MCQELVENYAAVFVDEDLVPWGISRSGSSTGAMCQFLVVRGDCTAPVRQARNARKLHT
jgi:hypothetical protein